MFSLLTVNTLPIRSESFTLEQGKLPTLTQTAEIKTSYTSDSLNADATNNYFEVFVCM